MNNQQDNNAPWRIAATIIITIIAIAFIFFSGAKMQEISVGPFKFNLPTPTNLNSQIEGTVIAVQQTQIALSVQATIAHAVVLTAMPPSTDNTSLIINGKSYSYPDPSSSFRCIAQDQHTNGKNIVAYDVIVPEGWVMMWNSYKANWASGSYDGDGLLIITGPWTGQITINTGGSCSGPIEWYDQIKSNRISDYYVANRLEYKVP